MRVAHFSIWAPNRSGMYHTTRDIILGQRELGIDCGFIDSQDTTPKTDGTFEAFGHRYADLADIYMLHLSVPEPYFSDGTPTVVVMHGHPLYSMQTELYGLEAGNEAPFTTILNYMKRSEPTWFVNFWEQEQGAYWRSLDGIRKQHRIRFVPRGIHFGPDLCVDGPKRHLDGDPVIVIADQFRLFKDALPCLWGAYEYARAHPNARIHIYALPPQGIKQRDVLDKWIGNSQVYHSLGGMYGVVDYLPEVLRTADVVVSTVTGESRVVLEAQACGCKVVGPWPEADACVLNYWQPEAIADGIERALDNGRSRAEVSERIRERFPVRKTAEALRDLYEEILADG